MIIYSKRWYGLHLLFRLYGSAIPRAILFATLASLFNALLFYFPGHDVLAEDWNQPFAYNALAVIIGFILVFRSNFGYTRYMEGSTNLRHLSGRLTEAAVAALNYEAMTIDDEVQSRGSSSEPASFNGMDRSRAGSGSSAVDNPGLGVWAAADVERLNAFTQQMLHLCSLYHALCLLHMRLDWKLSNLKEHVAGDRPPPEDAAGLPGLSITFSDIFILSDSTDKRAHYNQVAKLSVIGGVSKEERGLLKEYKEMQARAKTETLLTGLSSKSMKSINLENDTAVPVGENTNNKTNISEHVPHTSTSGCETGTSPHVGATMGVRKRGGSRASSPNAELAHGRHSGLLFKGRKFVAVQLGIEVEGATERVYTAYTWLHMILAQRMHTSKGWNTAVSPPTTAGVLGSLKESLAAFEQCRKLSETPFPFPWAQMIIVLLLIFSLTLPMLVAAYIPALWLSLLITFCTVLTYWSINEVSREVEAPFLYPPNDLPLQRMQHNFNEQLLTVAETLKQMVAPGSTAVDKGEEGQGVDVGDGLV